MSKRFLSLDYEKVQKSFPLSLRAVEEWFLDDEQMKKGLMTMGANIDEAGILRLIAASVIQYDPRKLYDVFDDLGCSIYISDHQSTSLESVFYYYNSMNRVSKVAPDRRSAEQAAFMEAFEILEKTLADGKNQAGVQTSDRSI